MARKRNPADTAVEYFQTADVDAAQAILDVCAGILKRRRAGESARVTRRSSRAASSSAASTSGDAGAGLPLDGGRQE